MTAIINKIPPIDLEYSQYNDKFLGNLEDDTCHCTPTHRCNPTHPTHPTQTDRKQALQFILAHFAAIDFPRRISTRTTEGRQVLVNDNPEALARFKQANQLDCRISAYTDLDETPNFLFIDVDSLDFSTVEKVLNKCKVFAYFPTVLFTGSGYHIYQPVTAVRLENLSEFAAYKQENLPKQFLKFAAEYLADDKADVNHNPSLKSCMVRVPGSINSKNGKEVQLVQEWNGARPSIVPLLGIFYSWLATKKIVECKRIKSYKKNSTGAFTTTNKISWIENKLLGTPLDDYRKTIVNLVLAPYLSNVRQLDYEASLIIIKPWLELCATKRKLDFNADSLIGNALNNAKNSGYRPMRLDTLRTKNSRIYETLGVT